jgi:sugar lactone lactonase YvrE
VGLDGQTEILAEIDDLPGGLGWLPDGRLLMVSMTRRVLLVLTKQGFQPYADLHDLASFHCNDLVVDNRGNAYAGNFGFDLHGGKAQSPAELVFVGPDGSTRVVAQELIFPNGAVITPDGKTLIVAETFASRLTAFSITEDGSLTERRLWAPLGEANPDGICLDDEGAIWVAAPNLGQVLRVTEGGKVDRRLQPKGDPYACMLGGKESRTLFITSSETDNPEQARRQKSGRIEMVEVAVAGAGLP